MIFIHVFYVQGWVISMVTYIIVYVEILVVLFWTFGAKFVEDSLTGAFANCGFYTILFAAVVGLSIFAFRTYELRERAGFFAELQTRYEMEGWRALLNDLPEPVILAQAGAITFFNNATHKLLDKAAERSTETEMLELLDSVKQDAIGSKSLKDYIAEQSTIAEGASGSSFSYTGNGKINKLTVKGVEIKQKNGTVVFEYIVHDVTAVEELQQEKNSKTLLPDAGGHCLARHPHTNQYDPRSA